MSKNVTLVLSGGGARGIAHIGVIEELLDNGYTISSISGTSMGALVGGIYAVGKLEEFKEWLLKLEKLDVIGLLDFTFSSQGLIKGDKVFKELKKFIPDVNIEDLNIRFSLNAFDLNMNNEIVFISGSLLDAIRASVSIPTIFKPVIIGNLVLVDGGVTNNIPVNHAIRVVNDIMIAVNVNSNIPLNVDDAKLLDLQIPTSIYIQKLQELRIQLFGKSKKSDNFKMSYFDLISKTLASMIDQITNMTLQKYPPDLLIEISKESSEMYDFYKAKSLIEIGRIQTRKALQKIE